MYRNGLSLVGRLWRSFPERFARSYCAKEPQCSNANVPEDPDVFGSYVDTQPAKRKINRSPVTQRKNQTVDEDSRQIRNRSPILKRKDRSPNVRRIPDDLGDRFGDLNSEPKKASEFDMPFSETTKEKALHVEETLEKPKQLVKSKTVEELDAEKAEKLFSDEPDFQPFVIYKHTTKEYQMMQRKYAMEGKIPEMVAVLEKRMPEDRVKPCKANFHEAITHLGRYGQPRKAFELYMKMKRMDIPPPVKTLVSLVNACSNCAPTEREWALNQTKLLLSDAREHPIRPPIAFYHVCIKAFSRHGEIEWAFRVADMLIQDGLTPNILTFNHLLHACISDKESGFKLALELWQAMHSAGMRADTQFYNLILRCCRDCGLGTAGNQFLQQLDLEYNASKILLPKHAEQQYITSGVKVDNRTISTDTLGQERQMDDDEQIETSSTSLSETSTAKSLMPTTNFKLSMLRGIDGILALMKRDHAKPDVRSFAMMLDIIPKCNLDDENRLLQAMTELSLTPDIDFLNSLISRRCRRGQYNEALAVLGECRKHMLQLNERTFTSLAAGCYNRERGLTLLRDMEALGLKPNLYVLTVLLSRALRPQRYYNFPYAISILNYMRRLKLEINLDTLKFLEKRLEEARQIEDERLQTMSRKDANQERDIPTVLELTEFKKFYYPWLAKMRTKDESVDEKLKLLDKHVDPDSLRENWEKPWVAQMEQQREKERLEKAKVVAVD